MKDVVIIGAGIIGTSIARELSRYNLDIVIVEKQNDVACGATKANSALIHAGFDAPHDSLKGITNVRGNYLYDQVCKELSVPFERIGALVVAFGDDEMPVLERLLENGKKLGIKGLDIINREKVKEMEPNINDAIIAALYAPTAGIINPWEMAMAFAENAIDNGAELKLNFDVKAIDKVAAQSDKANSERFVVKSESEEIETRIVINASGIYGDTIYELVDTPYFKIRPRRGEYYLLDSTTQGVVSRTIFKCPGKMGKGVILSPTIDGNITVGPNSKDLDLQMKLSTETTLDGLENVKAQGKVLVPNLPFGENITNYAGLRAEPDSGDFIVEESPQVKGFINVAGIKSPGLSSAPAIAEMVVEIVKTIAERDDKLEKNKEFNPYRKIKKHFYEMTNDERDELIKKDPRYGRVICRCENVTEGEIIDAIHSTCGATTLNGIKRRLRPGAGRCQGGFCSPRVTEIIARELDIDMTEVLQENQNSNVLMGKTKA